MKWRQKEIMAYKNEKKKKNNFQRKNYCFFPKKNGKKTQIQGIGILMIK